ncbi:MAG: DUF1330 domain-containing protein [Spirochaetes bacterium]|nr:DUF1330 domain-containing protein [Spirochaetota bacterium]
MSAYVISEVEIIDSAAADEYRRLAADSIGRYGGRYIVRGALPETAEGDGAAGRIVVVEFPSMQRIREWYSSEEYAAALAYRKSALKRRLLFVEGIEGAAGE